MPDAPTFNRDTGEPCKCLSQKQTGWGVQSLLLLIGLSVLFGTGYSLTQLMPTPPSALPPTAPAARTSFASPSPTTAVPSPSPTLNPLIPPTYQVVVVTTLTPIPTATMTTFQTQATAVIQTQVAGMVPQPCEQTTVTPGTPEICFWIQATKTPIPTPTYQTCSTPVPGAYCRKES